MNRNLVELNKFYETEEGKKVLEELSKKLEQEEQENELR